jgi:hypothetical protein
LAEKDEGVDDIAVDSGVHAAGESLCWLVEVRAAAAERGGDGGIASWTPGGCGNISG